MTDYDHNATLDAALTALAQKEYGRAQKLCRLATENRPDDAEGWSVLGLSLVEFDGAEAEQYLRKAVDVEPQEPRWWLHLGGALLRLGQAEASQDVLAKASELSKGHPEAMTLWADSLMSLKRFGDAAQVMGRVLQSQPSTDNWIKAGEALMGAGDTINAAEAYERAYPPGTRPIEMSGKLAELHILLNQYDKAQKFNDEVLSVEPDNADAGLRAANLKRWRGDHESAIDIQTRFLTANPVHPGLIAALLDDRDASVLDRALKLVRDTGVAPDKQRLVRFALARHFDRQGELDAAWEHAVAANALYETPYVDLKREATWLEAALKSYASLPQVGEQSTKMIYVMGPPRCGGSLLQTILARVEGLVSVGERGALLSWLISGLEGEQDLAGSLQALAKADMAGMQTAAGAAKAYIDKASPHILFAGLLAKIHQGTKFVVPVRDPKDMAVSMFFHDFPEQFLYTRSITGISDYLKLQALATQGWKEAGLDIIDHDHDAFVADPNMQGQALFDALSLPWSEAVLDTGGSDSVTRTFSARQVTDSVSQKYQGRGERYADYLAKSGFDL